MGSEPCPGTVTLMAMVVTASVRRRVPPQRCELTNVSGSNEAAWDPDVRLVCLHSALALECPGFLASEGWLPVSYLLGALRDRQRWSSQLRVCPGTRASLPLLKGTRL